MKITKIIAIGALVVFFASCCACRNNGRSTGMALTDTRWQVVQLDGANFSASNDSFTLTFSSADNRVSGRGDCNNVSGSYETNNTGKLQMNGLASTRAFCPDQTSEDKFMSILNDADSYSIDGSMLMIFSNGQLRMMLEAK